MAVLQETKIFRFILRHLSVATGNHSPWKIYPCLRMTISLSGITFVLFYEQGLEFPCQVLSFKIDDFIFMWLENVLSISSKLLHIKILAISNDKKLNI